MSAFQVWYARPDFVIRTMTVGRPNPADLNATHIHLKDIEADGAEGKNLTLHDVYQMFQIGSVGMAPKGELRALIRTKGLKHLGMRTGDVMVDYMGQAWAVIPTGFVTIREPLPPI